MSTLINKQDRDEAVLPLKGPIGRDPITSENVSIAAFLGSLQAPSSKLGDIFSEDELKELKKDLEKEERLEDTSKAPFKKGNGGKNAVAESAKLMSLLQNEAQKNLSSELQQEEKLLEAELKVAMKEEALWNKLINDWNEYKDHPSKAEFKVLEEDIKAIFGSGTSKGKNAGEIKKLVEQAKSKRETFALELGSMSDIIKLRVKDLLFQIQFLQMIEQIVSGGGSAIVQMQALMNVVIEMGIHTNTESTERNQIMNKFNIENLKQKEKKIQKEIDKLKDKHGLLGWIEDLFHSIVEVFKTIGHLFEDIGNNDGKAFLSDIEKLMGIDKIKAAIKEIQAGNLKKGFEDLFVTIILMCVIRPLVSTDFGKDMANVVKLAIDTSMAAFVSALDGITGAIENDKGNKAEAKTLLAAAKKVWSDLVDNPALEAVSQLVTVAIVMAAALSGQFYLAALMTTFFFLSTTGALGKLTKNIAESIEKKDHNKALAKLYADIIVITVMVVASLGVGAAGSALSSGASAAEESATSGIQAMGKAIGSTGGAALTGLGTSLLDTNFGFDVASVAIKENKEKWELVLEIVNDIVGAIAAIAGGGGMASGGFSNVDANIGKMLSNVSSYFEENSAQLADFANSIQKAGFLIGGKAQTENGGFKIKEGEIMRELERLYASVNQNNTEGTVLSGWMHSLVTEYKNLTKEEGQVNKDAFNAAGAGIEGDIRALTGQV